MGNGFVVAYKRYSKRYLKTENYAKNKSGYLAKEFTTPEQWRRKNK